MFFFSFFRKTFFLPPAAAVFAMIQLFLPGCFLLGDGRTSRTFAGTRVCMRALTAYRQAAAMTQATISANVHQPLDVHLHTFAEVTFDFALGFEDRANATQVIFRQVSDPRVEVDMSLVQDRCRSRPSNAIDIRKTNLRTFVGRKIDACNTSHYLI